MSERDDASYIQHLEAKVKQLEEEIASLRKEKGLSSAGDGLTFNDETGTHTDASGKHFCTKCLAKEKRHQLKTEPHGWRCVICDEWYEDPDNPEGSVRIVPDMGGGGPQGWMR